MKVGYARVSTTDQNLDLQITALEETGCEKIFTDTASGAISTRMGLNSAIDSLSTKDTLYVWKLDRLGRSLKQLIENVAFIEKRGAGLVSLTENICTTNPGGRLVFHVFGALAQFERELIIERTKAGLLAAKQNGRSLGRPSRVDQQKHQIASRLIEEESMSISEICKFLGISRSTYYRHFGNR